MRKTLKLVILWIACLGLGAALPQMIQAQNAQKNEPSTTVSGSGCVDAGVEAGCIVLKDTKSGTLYNLFFAGKKPALGTAIEFSGTPHGGPTTCMQGKAVKVKEWKQIRMECPPPSSGKKP